MGRRYVVRRVAALLPTLGSVLVVTFLLVHLGHADPSVELAGEGASPERVLQIRHQLGLDQPLPRQFVSYVDNLAHGRLGQSTSQAQPVSSVISHRIGPTLLLTGAALAISTVLGLLMGVVAAARPRSVLDFTISTGALVAYAVPAFWLAQIAVVIFAVHLHLVPLLGYVDARHPYTGWRHVDDIAYHLILPAIVLAASEVALLTRVTRTGLIRELDQEYALAARARGVPESDVLGRHAMRNAMLPVVTILGTRIGFLASGALIIETAFSWPGLGTAMSAAVRSGDVALVQGVVVVVAVGVVLANLLTDLVYAWIDPRARVP